MSVLEVLPHLPQDKRHVNAEFVVYVENDTNSLDQKKCCNTSHNA